MKLLRTGLGTLAILQAAFLMPPEAGARQVLVPQDHLSIMEAVAASIADDTIRVSNGEYLELVRFPSHRLYVMSNYLFTSDSTDIFNTIINGSPYTDQDTATVIWFGANSPDSSSIEGFTITGGIGILDTFYNQRFSAAFRVDSSSPTIAHNFFTGNSCYSRPLGDFATSSGRFLHNLIRDNTFENIGMGVDENRFQDPVLIEGNDFGPNPISPGAFTPAILVGENGRAVIRQNRFHNYTGRYTIAVDYGGYDAQILGNVFDSLVAEEQWGSIVFINRGPATINDNVFSAITIHDYAALSLAGGLNFYPANVEGNVFESIRKLSDVNHVGAGAIKFEGYDAVVRNNIFRNDAGSTAGALLFQEAGVGQPHLDLTYNLFEACSLNGPWNFPTGAVARMYQEEIVARQNIFRHNFPGAVGYTWSSPPSTSCDFTLNYWGDPSGPYHPLLNPNGLGDVVGDSVLFDPWLTDSLIDRAHDILPPLPETFSLVCYPNPFNPVTKLKFTVPEPGRYRMELYDLMGREVKDIFEGGVVIERELTVHGEDLPSGVYFARASESLSRRPVATAKLVLVK